MFFISKRLDMGLIVLGSRAAYVGMRVGRMDEVGSGEDEVGNVTGGGVKYSR